MLKYLFEQMALLLGDGKGHNHIVRLPQNTLYAEAKYFSFLEAVKCVMWVVKGNASFKAMLPHQHGLWRTLQAKYS